LFGVSPTTTHLLDDVPTPLESSTVDTALLLQDVELYDTMRVLRSAPHKLDEGTRIVADDLRRIVRSSRLDADWS